MTVFLHQTWPMGPPSQPLPQTCSPGLSLLPGRYERVLMRMQCVLSVTFRNNCNFYLEAEEIVLGGTSHAFPQVSTPTHLLGTGSYWQSHMAVTARIAGIGTRGNLPNSLAPFLQIHCALESPTMKLLGSLFQKC